MGHEGEENAPREVPAAPDGTGAKDKVAPVAGGKTAPLDFMAVYEGLGKRDRAKFAAKLLESRPEQIAAARLVRRDRIRVVLTIVIFLAIIGDAAAALYFAQVAKVVSWDTVKDWLVLALAPLVAAATVAVTFWFPSKEGD